MVLLRVCRVRRADFAKCALNCILVPIRGLVHRSLLRLQVGVQVAALENRPRYRRPDGAIEGIAPEELLDVKRFKSEGTVQVEFRIEQRSRNANMGDLRRKGILRRAHVRTGTYGVQRYLRELKRLYEPVAVGTFLQLRMQGARQRSGQDCERIHKRLLGGQQGRDRRTGLLHVVLGLVHGKLITDAGIEPALEDVVRLRLEFQVLPRHHEPFLYCAQLDILAADLGRERHPRIRKVARRLVHQGLRLLYLAAHSAKDVDFPGRVKSGTEHVAMSLPRRTVLPRLRTGCGANACDVRHHVRPRAGKAPTGLLKPLLGHQERTVVRYGVLHEIRQQPVVELAPPSVYVLRLEDRTGILRLRCRTELPGLRKVRRHWPPGPGGLQRGVLDLELWALEVRPDFRP